MNKDNDEAWDIIKRRAVFVMRGTVKELCTANLTAWDGDQEYIFAMLPVENKP